MVMYMSFTLLQFTVSSIEFILFCDGKTRATWHTSQSKFEEHIFKSSIILMSLLTNILSFLNLTHLVVKSKFGLEFGLFVK